MGQFNSEYNKHTGDGCLTHQAKSLEDWLRYANATYFYSSCGRDRVNERQAYDVVDRLFETVLPLRGDKHADGEHEYRGDDEEDHR